MKLIKILLVLALIGAIAFVLSIGLPAKTKQEILGYVEQLATNLPFYAFLKEEVLGGTWKGLVAFVAFSNIPILPNPPVEPYIIFVYTKGVDPFIIVLTIACLTVITSTLSYLFGYLFGPSLIEKITGKPFTFSERMDFLSAPVTFITHMLPIPNIFPFIFGAYHSHYRNFIIAVFLATAIRFAAVLFIFQTYGNALLSLPFMQMFG